MLLFLVKTTLVNFTPTLTFVKITYVNISALFIYYTPFIRVFV